MEQSQGSSTVPLLLVLLPGDSHLTEAAAEPELLGEAEADEVAQAVSVESLLEFLALEDFDVIIESGNRLQDEVDVPVEVIDDDPVGH